MKKISFWKTSEHNGRRYAETAVVLNKKPSVGEKIWLWGSSEIVKAVRPAIIDNDQPTENVRDYDIYEVEVYAPDGMDDDGWLYIAVKQEAEAY